MYILNLRRIVREFYLPLVVQYAMKALGINRLTIVTYQ